MRPPPCMQHSRCMLHASHPPVAALFKVHVVSHSHFPSTLINIYACYFRLLRSHAAAFTIHVQHTLCTSALAWMWSVRLHLHAAHDNCPCHTCLLTMTTSLSVVSASCWPPMYEGASIYSSCECVPCVRCAIHGIPNAC